ncbi:MAG: hypothetical protein ACFFB2_15030 [Promethearchaeota archaeon]
MSQELKEKLLKEFPGKIENEQAFIIQYIVNTAHDGNKPPPKNEIEECINAMVNEGIFEKKGSLLILKSTKPTPMEIQQEEEDEEVELPNISINTIKGDFTENQKRILASFQGKYENRAAIIMNATMAELSQGRKPPKKGELERSIDELIEKGILELKGSILIKKS